ncbi:hypothetical protein [Arthrobacter sp. CAN_A1]|uniref:hypothetical protein n=1 Tax=Arthrobacter sp. CAN_A1 TaxID=2787717 RepID=UPI001A236C76
MMRMVVVGMPTGILLPESIVHTELFAVLAAFVAINTVMYAALAASKILPKVYPSDWVRGRNRRSETRSIYPEGYSAHEA